MEALLRLPQRGCRCLQMRPSYSNADVVAFINETITTSTMAPIETSLWGLGFQIGISNRVLEAIHEDNTGISR